MHLIEILRQPYVQKTIPRSYNKAFGVDIMLQSLGVRFVSYALGVYKDFYGRSGRVNFRKGSFDWKCIILVPF